VINEHDMRDLYGRGEGPEDWEANATFGSGKNSGKTEAPKTFKVGDRVRIIGDSIDDFQFFSLGAEGRVEELCEDDISPLESDMLVMFDTGEYVTSDSEGNPCSWYVQSCDAELIELIESVE
jgi:hypothetical protein